MRDELILMNFRIPKHLKLDFEDACHRLHMPMTAQIRNMMQEFIQTESKLRESDDNDTGVLRFFSDAEERL